MNTTTTTTNNNNDNDNNDNTTNNNVNSNLRGGPRPPGRPLPSVSCDIHIHTPANIIATALIIIHQ